MLQIDKSMSSSTQAAALHIKWNQDLQNGFFDMEPYLSARLQKLPLFDDFFTTSLRLDPLNHVPALPARYAKEYNEERVMYLFNVPASMTRTRLQSILEDFGVVQSLPTLTDLVSMETFRWVVMSKKEEAARLFKMLRLVPVVECGGGNILAVTPCRPGRGLVLRSLRARKDLEVTTHNDSVPIHGEKVEVREEVSILGQRTTLPQRKSSKETKYFNLNPRRHHILQQQKLIRQIHNPQMSSQQRFSNLWIRLSPAVGGRSGGLRLRPDKRREMKPADPLLAMLMKTVAAKAAQVSKEIPAKQGNAPRRKAVGAVIAIPDLSAKQSFALRSRTGSSSTRSHTSLSPAETYGLGTTMLPKIGERRDAGNDIKGSGRALESGQGLTNFSSDSATVQSTAITAASSWAAIANAGTSAKTIDIASVPTNASGRPGSTSHAGGDASKPEPLADQMRVVFILDIPTTLTYDDISNAVREGPIRSIHFGMDEEKNSRFCAIVFQYAKDAVAFVKVLQKERVESRPDRFRWIVDVVRGEEPFPLDDVLRAMQPPTFATRRLTLVKASLFFMIGERQLRARIERIVGEGTIQLIWLYNGGNATVVFSDVSSAIAVKEEFDRYSATAGKRDGAPLAWAGLQTSFSKDPCVQPLDLKTAMHD